MGEIASPTMRSVYNVSATGKPVVLPGVGGITYNLRVGDPACGWEADHVEPGVSIRKQRNDARSGTSRKHRLQRPIMRWKHSQPLASGDAKGAKGIVTGKHGGIEHVLIDFPPEILEKLVLGDRILVKAFGVGLKLLGFSRN